MLGPLHLSVLGAAALGSLTVLTTTTASPIDRGKPQRQTPLLHHSPHDTRAGGVSPALFTELEELSRLVDISYCVSTGGIGVTKPFSCLSRCKDFPAFELLTTWDTGPLLSDSSGYVALDHGRQRVVVAFRGTYSLANTVVDLSSIPQKYAPYPGNDNGGGGEDACANCTVHTGFHSSWLNTRPYILPSLEKAALLFPSYRFTLVGHSLGGAVAALAALDLQARGYDPQVTTFGGPRIGNAALAKFLNARFSLGNTSAVAGHGNPDELKFRRVTHVDDPVPLLPLTEWGFYPHAGEIYISKPSLSPDMPDLHHCIGDADPGCIAGQDSTLLTESHVSQKRDLLVSVADEVKDVMKEPWGIPTRYKLWQLFFAHRDYFWRLGLCVPGGDPLGGGGKYHFRDNSRMSL